MYLSIFLVPCAQWVNYAKTSLIQSINPEIADHSPSAPEVHIASKLACLYVNKAFKMASSDSDICESVSEYSDLYGSSSDSEAVGDVNEPASVCDHDEWGEVPLPYRFEPAARDNEGQPAAKADLPVALPLDRL